MSYAPTDTSAVITARYPPHGDRDQWIRQGPEGATSEARNWDAKRIAEHAHAASEAGGLCGVCGFPWWPERVQAARDQIAANRKDTA